jgi:Xylose isomerase-like TIM barrel
MLAPHSYRLAYENWCWATAAPTWSLVYEIVKLADRPNIGLCLDTFQTAGSEYADPTTKSGLLEHLGTQQQLEANFKASLVKLTNTIPKEKIYLLQISDAYKPPQPLEKGEVEGLRARGRWSHDFRPYLWNGGYLTTQCVDVARAVLGTGSRCWFSVEVFDGGADGKGGMRQYDKGEFCRGAMGSVRKLLGECGDEK